MLRTFLLGVTAAAAIQAGTSYAGDTPRAVPRTVAIVNGVSLLSDRLEAAVSSLLPLESFHQNVSADKVDVLRRKALMQIVDDELQYQDAVRRGVTVRSAELEAALDEAAKRYPTRKAFTEALTRSGASLGAMRHELRRRIAIRKVHEQQVTARCAVGRDETSRFFAQYPDRFVEPERLQIHAITVGVDPSSSATEWTVARERAEDVRAQLVNGAAFDELARKYSTDSSGPSGGDMGLVHRGSLSPALEEVTASLPVGEPSAIVETIYGYHIIRVAEILPPRPRSFDDVGARLQQELSAERCAATKDTWIAGLRSAAKIAYPQ